MATPQELNGQADLIAQALALSRPQTDTCIEKMEDLEAVLADTKSYCVMYLRANSYYGEFDALRNLIIKIRGSVDKIVNTIGVPPRDGEPIKLAGDLLDALGIHIDLSMSVQELRAQHAPIGSELGYLRSSRADITTALDKFASSTEILFDRLRDENAPR